MPWMRSKKKKSKKMMNQKMMNQKKIKKLGQKRKKEMIIGRNMKKIWKYKINPIKRYIIKMETW